MHAGSRTQVACDGILEPCRHGLCDLLCGHRASELIVARLGVLLCAVIAISLWVGGMLPIFYMPERFAALLLGFLLAGWVYGCYGLLVGALLRGQLEGILFGVLLANIDAGWLQNPLYYANAQNQILIRALPAFYPSQLCLAAAFTSHEILRPGLLAFGYGLALLGAALLAASLRARGGARRGG